MASWYLNHQEQGLFFGFPEGVSNRPTGPCTRKFVTKELMDPLRKRAHEKTYP
jgi:hypothetical protein